MIEQKRLRRALEIVRNGGVTPNVEAKSYTVKSQSGNWEYIVNTLVTGRKCGCKDHQNGHVCKHIIAAELLQVKRIALAIKEKVQERMYSSTLVFQMNHVILRIQGHNDLQQSLKLDGNVEFLKSQAHPWRREFGKWFDAMALLLQDKVEAEPEEKSIEALCLGRAIRKNQEKPLKVIEVQETKITVSQAYADLFDRDSAIPVDYPRGRGRLFK